MKNLRALSLTCVRVQLLIAGTDVCDIMTSLSTPELFLHKKSRYLYPVDHNLSLISAFIQHYFHMPKPLDEIVDIPLPF